MSASTNTRGAARLLSIQRFLAHPREHLSFEVGFLLWDGSTVPADLSSSELTIAIADEGAVAALMRRPKLETIVNLWVAARIDIRNGSIFDLAARRSKVRTRHFLKNLYKRLALATAAKFAFLPRVGPWPFEKVRADRTRADG